MSYQRIIFSFSKIDNNHLFYNHLFYKNDFNYTVFISNADFSRQFFKHIVCLYIQNMFCYLFNLFFIPDWFCRTVQKHFIHSYNISNIPIIEILVKGTAISKHAIHFCNIIHIPISQGLIKLITIREHCRHLCNLRNIPISQGLIKQMTTNEHYRHICNLRNIPI